MATWASVGPGVQPTYNPQHAYGSVSQPAYASISFAPNSFYSTAPQQQPPTSSVSNPFRAQTEWDPFTSDAPAPSPPVSTQGSPMLAATTTSMSMSTNPFRPVDFSAPPPAPGPFTQPSAQSNPFRAASVALPPAVNEAPLDPWDIPADSGSFPEDDQEEDRVDNHPSTTRPSPERAQERSSSPPRKARTTSEKALMYDDDEKNENESQQKKTGPEGPIHISLWSGVNSPPHLRFELEQKSMWSWHSRHFTYKDGVVMKKKGEIFVPYFALQDVLDVSERNEAKRTFTFSVTVCKKLGRPTKETLVFNATEGGYIKGKLMSLFSSKGTFRR